MLKILFTSILPEKRSVIKRCQPTRFIRTHFYTFLSLLVVLCFSACKSNDEPQDELQIEQDFLINETLTVNGEERSYVLYLPTNYYENEDFPLVIAMHGGAGSAQQFEASAGLSSKAEDSKFVLVYPEGIQRPGIFNFQTWNAGACCGYAVEQNQDDVTFISSLIDELSVMYKLNSKRIYATGHSNGGMMSYRLACELSDKITAIAPNGSTMVTTSCNPSRPIPVIHFHSTLDTNIPYLGGTGSGAGTLGIELEPIDSVLNLWAINNNCMNSADLVEENDGYIHTRWENCNNNVALEYYLTKDGGHSWPGGNPDTAGADAPSTAINANDLMWDFFQRYELP